MILPKTILKCLSLMEGGFLPVRRYPLPDVCIGVYFTSRSLGFGLTNGPTSLDFLSDCLFSPKCVDVDVVML